MIKKVKLAGMLVVAMTSSGYLATASDTVANIGGAKGDSSQSAPVEVSSMAHQLIRYGDTNKDAMSLIVAAKILKQNPTRVLETAKTSEGSASGKGDTKTTETVDNSVQGILLRAKAYADGQVDLIAMVDDVAVESTRGRLQGPSEHVDRVSSGKTDVYKVTFRGGQQAAIGVVGDGDTDLDFRVYDANGNLIAYDIDATDRTYLSWTPRNTGKFTIKIKNLGRVYNRYTLLTN